MRRKGLIIITFLLLAALSFEAGAQYGELVGQEVVLTSRSEYGPVYVGADKKGINAMLGNLMGRDRRNYLVCILNHKGIEVNNFTRARILDVSFYEQIVKVKILEGTYKGKVGWVLFEQAAGY